MIPYFPKKLADKGFLLYIIALVLVSILFMHHTMKWYFYFMGIGFVALFLYGSAKYSKEWLRLKDKDFKRTLFLTSLILRVAWVFIAYFFYTWATGDSFEFSCGDSLAYHEAGEWLMDYPLSFAISYLESEGGYSDMGYQLYLTILYKIYGPNVLVTRLIKTVWGALTAVLLYKLAARNIGENGGRMVGVFACFMPNLIIYCGLHLKEIEMLTLLVAFLERSDYLIRGRHYNVINIATALVLGASLFLFRTVLGVTAFFALLTGIVTTQKKIIGTGKKVILAAWCITVVITLAGGTLMMEVEKYWNLQFSNESVKRTHQSNTSSWAKYATGAVMAPMIFVLPFPTMVAVDNQEQQNVMHGGNFVRNFFGGFVILGLYMALFKRKNWRNLSLIGAYAVAYLGIITTSGYANSERFLLPGLPGLLIIAAYGITQLDAKNYHYVKYWYYIVPVMSIAWAYFKLGSRGMF